MPNGMRADAWRPRATRLDPFNDICCWPGCEDDKGEFDLPLCNHHTAKVWRTVQRNMDRVVERGQNKPGIIYCIRLGDKLKIGWTANLPQRLNSLPHEEVVGTVSGAMVEERAIHRMFDHLRVTGEWFRDDPEIRRFVGRWAS